MLRSHKVLNISSPNPVLQDKLSQELKISKILAQILINRKICDINEAKQFLDVKLGALLDPFDFCDMQKAVERVKKASAAKEKVLVFGDYDVDGITSVVLLQDVLKKCGIEAEHYMPHRIKEGYGLNKNIADIAKKRNISLLITADCGTSNIKEIEELQRRNIDVIVTDHHEPSSSILPPALAIINPKIKNSGYKFRDLAGVGVAYKFCQAISAKLLENDLDLVCLGTIADSVPLIGENRVIAKEGLLRLAKTTRPGLKVLIENAGIKNKKFSSTSVTFIIGPRLNASGRMDTAETSLNLLKSASDEEANSLAKIVEGHNRARQKVEAKILEEAQDLVNREVNFKEHKIIVIAKEDWHQGVLGIVASKLADRFYRPAIVISLTDDLCKGSGRSIKNFHLFNALIDCKEFLSAFGGHSHAIGLMITKDSIGDFKNSINRLANERLSLGDLLPSLDIDMEVGLSDLNEENIAEMERLEPFGVGNPEPLFYTRNLKLKQEPQILSRETIKFWVSDGKAAFQAIGFGMASLKESIQLSEYFDLIYTPRIDTWRDDSSVILEIKEVILR